jgi:hypothetical protein
MLIKLTSVKDKKQILINSEYIAYLYMGFEQQGLVNIFFTEVVLWSGNNQSTIRVIEDIDCVSRLITR